MAALDNIHTTYNYTSAINILPLYLFLLFLWFLFTDVSAYQFVGPSLLLYPNQFMFFISFLCYMFVTEGLTSLQFISYFA